MSILHSSIMSQSETLVSVDFTVDDEAWYEVVGRFALRSCIPVIGAVMNIVEGVQIVGGAINNFFTTSEKKELALDKYEAKDYPNVLYLPFYTITAEEIFKGNIAMFDINFFNPKDVYVKSNAGLSSQVNDKTWEITEKGRQYKNSDPKYAQMNDHDFMFHMALRRDMKKDDVSGLTEQGKRNHKQLEMTQEEFDGYIKTKPVKLSDLSKEELNNINAEYYYYLDENGQEVRTSMDNTASVLSGVISKWYKALRNIALVLMMSILLYIGIRMLLSTVSADKAKYKQMMVDWLVGMCLLFFMHYIMAFSVTLNNKFIRVINTVNGGSYVVTFENDGKKLLSEGLRKAGYGDFVSSDEKKIIWPTNLMGKVRIAAEMRHGRVSFIGYALCFIVLVFYTVFFAFTYLKRVIYLAFLTIISPFIAMTYAIDKVNDGQAQGFNKWLKEYIFNLLIQPLHLLLYTMLVSSVFSFASQNIWYMLVAIGFLIPAEKLLRSLFGFEKATTPGSLAGAAVGASLVSSGLGKLLHKVPGGPQGRGNNDKNKELSESKNPRINFSGEDFDSTGALIDSPKVKDQDEYQDEGEDNQNNNYLQGNKENQDNNYLQDNKENQDKIALNKYKQEGFKQNANGEFLNPYTDEYDPNYDPRKDDNYIKNNNLNDPTKSQQNLLGKEGDGKKDKLDKWLQNYNSQKVPWRRNKKTPRRIKLKRAMKVGAKRVFTGKNMRRALTSVGKKGIRMAAGATLAAAAGTIGVAAGIASGGGPSNVFQYGAAGIGAGALAGKRAADATMNTVGAGYDKVKKSETRNAMVEAYHSDEEDYKQRQQAKQIKQWKKNVEYKEQLERTLGEEQAKQMYKRGEIDEYLKNGITEIPDMAAMHQLQEKKIAGNIQEAMAIHEYGERVGGDYNRLRNKDKKEWGETFTEEFQQRGHSKEDSEKVTKATFDKIKEYHDIRKVIRTKM